MVKRIVAQTAGGYEQLKVEDGPPPLPPLSTQVTVDVKACGLNFYDIYVRQGISPYVQPPCVLGLECSGVISAVGDDVSSVKVGDRVAVHNIDGGTCSEQITIEENSVIAIPNNMSYEKAAAFTVNYLTAYFSLFHLGGLKENGAVLIHSAGGGVGWAATQLAKTVSNVTVFGTASSSKHDVIRQNGVDYPIHYDQDYSAEVLKYRKRGVSIVLDSLCGGDFSISQQLLEPLGKVILIGARGMVGDEQRSLWRLLKVWWTTKSVSPYSLMTDSTGIAGFNLNELKRKDPHVYRKGWEEILQKVSANILCPRIDSVWSFEDIIPASKQIALRKNIGKVIIKP